MMLSRCRFIRIHYSTSPRVDRRIEIDHSYARNSPLGLHVDILLRAKVGSWENLYSGLPTMTLSSLARNASSQSNMNYEVGKTPVQASRGFGLRIELWI